MQYIVVFAAIIAIKPRKNRGSKVRIPFELALGIQTLFTRKLRCSVDAF